MFNCTFISRLCVLWMDGWVSDGKIKEKRGMKIVARGEEGN